MEALPVDLTNLIAARAAAFVASLDDPTQWVALVAAAAATALIVSSSLAKTIIPMRWLALGGSVGFVVYGLTHPAPMVALLHGVLLPINLWRVLEVQRFTRRMRQAGSIGPDQLRLWLQPFMKRVRLKEGEVLFQIGDPADRFYVLVEGELELVEAGRRLRPGDMFGEIAFFSPEQRRTGTVRCRRHALLLTIDEVSFRQMFHQNPDFGFEVTRLMAGRLADDVRRLESRSVAAGEGAQGAQPEGPPANGG